MNLDTWPKPNTETPKLVEKTEQVESEQDLEHELSPEQIEQIMAKVQNINQIGTAYTCLPNKSYSREIFTNGLLGNIGDKWATSFDTSKESWCKNVRTKKGGPVYFNIVGTEDRASDDYKKEKRNDVPVIKNSHWGRSMEIVIIFDLSSYKPSKPFQKNVRGQEEEQRNRSYRYGIVGGEKIPSKDAALEFFYKKFPDGPVHYELVPRLIARQEIENDYVPSDKDWQLWLPKIHQEYGFSLSFRVTPRLFNGLVLMPRRNLTESEIESELKKIRLSEVDREDRIAQLKSRKVRETNSDEIMKYASQFILDMSEALAKKNILPKPIYDGDGNLLWPKQMSYEEVKKFVAEQDANNTNKEEK